MNDNDLVTIIAAYMISIKISLMETPPVSEEEGGMIIIQGVDFAKGMVEQIRKVLDLGQVVESADTPVS